MLQVILTEAYTSMENTTKYYKYGSHIPFNFNFIMNITKDSKPIDYKNVVEEWMRYTPNDGVANWVVSKNLKKSIFQTTK